MARPGGAQRWAQADQLADGIVDDEWRNRRRRIWVSVIAVSVLAGVAAGLLIALAAGHQHQKSKHF